MICETQGETHETHIIFTHTASALATILCITSSRLTMFVRPLEMPTDRHFSIALPRTHTIRLQALGDRVGVKARGLLARSCTATQDELGGFPPRMQYSRYKGLDRHKHPKCQASANGVLQTFMSVAFCHTFSKVRQRHTTLAL